MSSDIKPLVRVNITISPELFSLIDHFCQADNMTRTEMIETMLRQHPRVQRWIRRGYVRPLLPRRKAGRFPRQTGETT